MMKILLAYCGRIYRAVENLAQTEGIQLIGVSTFDEAHRHVQRGVDGLIVSYCLHENPICLGSPYDATYMSFPWGLILAVKAQKLNLPVILVSESKKIEVVKNFTTQFFGIAGQTTPQITHVGLSEKKARETYLELRHKIISQTPNSNRLVGAGQR